MIVVIDGYNLLKQIFPGLKKNLDKQRAYFVQQLAYYQKKKAYQISQIILVFDAGASTHAQRSVQSGIVIVFSGTRSSADDWILDFVERNQGKELLVVTLDKKLRESCQRMGADWLNVYDFYTIMQQHLLVEASKLLESHEELSDGQLEKYNHNDDDLEVKNIDKKALDLLMEQASLGAGYAYDNAIDKSDVDADKKSKSYTLSKKEKRAEAKLKKLK